MRRMSQAKIAITITLSTQHGYLFYQVRDEVSYQLEQQISEPLRHEIERRVSAPSDHRCRQVWRLIFDQINEGDR